MRLEFLLVPPPLGRYDVVGVSAPFEKHLPVRSGAGEDLRLGFFLDLRLELRLDLRLEFFRDLRERFRDLFLELRLGLRSGPLRVSGSCLTTSIVF